MVSDFFYTATIIDDHPLARMAIRGILENSGISIISEFEEGVSALTSIKKNPTDLVIVDVDIPVINGIEVVETLRSSKYIGVIVVISAKNERYFSQRASAAGANAFISKKTGMEHLLAALSAGKSGYSYFPFFYDQDKEASADSERLAALSSQEIKVLSFILQGLDNSQIGGQLNISAKTVSTYKSRLMDKLGCGSLIELISFAHHNKLV